MHNYTKVHGKSVRLVVCRVHGFHGGNTVATWFACWDIQIKSELLKIFGGFRKGFTWEELCKVYPKEKEGECKMRRGLYGKLII